MSTMISSKQMETQLYNLVSALADNYGFDADEAFEFARWETDTDHVGEILKVVEKPAPKKAPAKKEEPTADDASEAPTESMASDSADKIAACRKNIELWEKKLADGKVNDADKQREKIEKEQKKLAKILEKAPKVEAKKPEPKKVEVVKPAEKEKRIKRFSPVIAAQLKTALGYSADEMTAAVKKEFQQYVEDLADDDFRNGSLSDHMRTFAKLKIPVKEDDVNADESDAESEETVKMVPNAMIIDITLNELQSIEMTAPVDPPGTFWDADYGRFVKGPEADDDEDFDEVTFDSVKYVVGEKTGRVYEARDTGDVFAGFIGVGKFKKMNK
uniref:Uncharacterized protein n=1 Tax=viral metagenome TaxID=1070528 RepID=A0A6C0JP49_9ZZZZ